MKKKMIILIIAVILYFLTKDSENMNPALYILLFFADAGAFAYLGRLAFRE